MAALEAATSARQEVLHELERLEKELGWLLHSPEMTEAAAGRLLPQPGARSESSIEPLKSGPLANRRPSAVHSKVP